MVESKWWLKIRLFCLLEKLGVGTITDNPGFSSTLYTFYLKFNNLSPLSPVLLHRFSTGLYPALYRQKGANLANLLQDSLVFFDISLHLLARMDDGGVVSAAEFLSDRGVRDVEILS